MFLRSGFRFHYRMFSGYMRRSVKKGLDNRVMLSYNPVKSF